MTDAVLRAVRGIQGAREGPARSCRKGPTPPVPVSEWVAVCRLGDIVPNTGVCALVGGRQIAVFRLDDDRIYAIGNHDPFSAANVLSRGIVGDLKGELVVASPVYKQHFNLASGQCLEDPQVRVPVFAARLDGDVVIVEV
ncbi:MAG: nitrite reductase small subunit NirD [Betaproteobacteria bacterium]|nr:nitrite reductase small subunit NirD [Betaproteobacteria bacterium]